MAGTRYPLQQSARPRRSDKPHFAVTQTLSDRMRCLQQAGLSRRIALIGAALVFVCASSSTLRAATEPDEAQLKFFETSVRPLLVENCFSCHSAKKQKGGLRLDSQAAVLKGGKNGPVLVPGKPGESRLVTVVA
jgi:hypothetical protein